MEFRILGPLEVLADGQRVALGGAKEKALLTILVLHRGQIVSTDRLIDELWGDRAPATAVKTIQVYVSHLRKALGNGVVETHGRGYLLAVEAGQLDADRFEALAAAGRDALERGEPRSASAQLGEALEFWRGQPLADFTYESFAQRDIARLEELRLAATEDRIDADLALGKDSSLIGELEALVRDHPTRERLHGQLMLALYRCGRQADALARYQRARRTLLDELGLAPGPALRELERAILDHDPQLEAPAKRADAQTSRSIRRVRRGGALIAGGGLVLAATLIGALLVSSSDETAVRVLPNSVAAIDPSSDNVVAAFPVGARPGGITFGAGSLWVANLDDRTVSRVDPAALRTLRTVNVVDPPTGIAAGPSDVWVVGSSRDTAASVRGIDPQFDAVTHATRLGNVVPGGPGAIVERGDQLWVAPSSGLLTRLDPLTGRIVHTIDPNAGPTGVDVGAGAVWLTDTDADNVTRIDPTGLVTPIAVGHGPSGVVVGDGAVWVADSLDDTVVRIDPSTNAVTTTIRVGRSPTGVAVGAGSVWVADSGDGTVARIDPRSDRVLATIAVGGSPQAITVADGRAWVTVDARTITTTGAAAPGGTLRIESRSDVDFMDPALAYTAASAQLLYASCAQLLNYPDKAGSAGAQIIPEVARALPARSRDGKTYTFTIRSGFRFSPPSNAPVTAQTFKDTIERSLNQTMKSPVAHNFRDIVGASAYMAGRSAHIAGVVAQGDSLTIRLVAPAPDFLGRLTEPVFCAVPSDTPIDPHGVRIIPSAGPYYVKSYTPGQGVELARNPNYNGNRPHRLERIEFVPGVSGRQALADVEAGTADYTGLQFGSVSPPGAAVGPTQARDLANRYGPTSAAAAHGRQQYFVNALPALDYFDLNTHRPLFDDVRMRRAVNLAIDRRALADLGDPFQPLPEKPTDHYLPPGVPGFTEARAYPMTPSRSVLRRLARGHGRTAVLYTCDVAPCEQQAQIVKNDLRAIGLQVHVKAFPLMTLFTRLSKPGEPFDLAYGSWTPDYVDPNAMLSPLLEDSSVVPTFNDPSVRRQLAATERLSGPQRYLAYGKLDLELARKDAPLAAFGNLSSFDFFSPRIGCQTYGFYGIDLTALCVRRPAQ